LRALFSRFVMTAQRVAANWDNEEAHLIAEHASDVVSFGIEAPEAMIGIEPGTIEDTPTGIRAAVVDRRDDTVHSLQLRMPGRHNLSNALAAVAGAVAAGVSVQDAVDALATFQGLARRFDVIGTSASGTTVIDDFGHNPEKCRATLRTLKAHPGRVIAFFQPHGYGPLKQMGHELARTFAHELGPEDLTILCDPVYFGGTVDRSEGSERIVTLIQEAGGKAEYIPTREDCGRRTLEIARPGDRIVVMGARDDTLTDFAKSILARLDADAGRGG
jgi:UDP-N-acetylmuramate--alanine ligase